MTVQGLVSIVIPTYNTPTPWLAAAVASSRNQTYSNVEVIVVDDGSTPPVQMGGVHLLRQENRGTGAAINAGVAASSGEFILALGADDLIDPGTVEAMHSTLTSASDIVLAHPTIELFGTENATMATPDIVSLGDVALFNCLVASSLVRREHWEIGGGFDEHGDCSEDWVLWATLLGRTGGKAVKASGAVLRYRRTGTTQNVTNRSPERVQNARRYIAENLPEKTDELYLAAAARGAAEAAARWQLAPSARRWARIAPIGDPAYNFARTLKHALHRGQN